MAPATPRRVLVPLLAVVLLLLTSFAAAPAEAASQPTPYPVDLAYHVHDLDPAAGTVNVTLTIRDPDDRIRSFEFVLVNAPYDVSNLSATGGSLEQTEVGVKLTLEEPVVTFSYTVKVNKVGVQAAGGPRAGGDGSPAYHSYLAGSWGVLKAESFGVGFNVVHSDRVDPVWEGTVRFTLPDGWNVAGPWTRDGGAYVMPRDDPLPKGFVAVGEFTVDERQGPWKTYRYVRLGDAPSYETDLLPYLEASTPYLASIYGNHTGRKILAVSAPDPMFRGGLGGWNSLYLHESSAFKTLSHEYAHVWQRYVAVKTVGGSSLWIVEGDADLHGPLSLVASEFWSPQDAETHFQRFLDRAQREGHLDKRLVDATYGSDAERTAYTKGALVLQVLDQAMRNATDGRVGVPDLLRTLNEERSPVNPRYSSLQERRVTNTYLLDTVERLVGSPNGSQVRERLATYITSTDAPAWPGLDQEARVTFQDLRLDPPAGLPGHPSTATVTVQNTGATPASRTVELRFNGSVVDARTVELDPGRSTTLTFPLPDAEPGSYPVRVAYLTTAYRVLRPAELSLESVSVVPLSPRAGGSAEAVAQVHNAGGAPGNATVHVLVNGTEVAQRSFVVPGGISRSLAVAFPVPKASGNHTVTVEVTSSQVADGLVGRSDVTMHSVGDRDGDGVPDDEDDFPDDPRLTSSNPVTEMVHRVAGPGLLVALVALVLGAWTTRRFRS